MVGAIWKPLAPAPIIATRVPARSTSWSHRAEWKAGPANVSAPGSSGTFGRLSWPTAEMTARATSTSSAPSAARVRTDHVAESSSQVAPSTSVSHRTWDPMPYLSMTDWK